MSKNGYEFWGNVTVIRDIEDCIRSTKKYTEGVKTLHTQHPVQGADFPSRKFCKIYEVYPEMEISSKMGAGDAIDLLWGDTPCVSVIFNYDYRTGKASVCIDDRMGMLEMLLLGIPRLCELLDPAMTTNGHREMVTGIIIKTQNVIREKEITERASSVATLTAPKKHHLLDKLVDFITPRIRK